MRRVRGVVRAGPLALLGLALLAALGAGSGCRGPQFPPADRVVLITIDTLRADRLGSYGHASAHTPNLDALAGGGVRFARAIAPAPLTLPSHTSLMTALEPPAHGVRGNSIFVLEPGIPTLAEGMREAGFATGAFVAAFVLDARFGLDRGFDVYDDDIGDRLASDSPLSFAERPADAVVDAALAWVRTAPERFFLWVHLYDPHANYDPPPRFAGLAGGDLYDGEIAFADAQVARLLAGIQRRFGAERLAVVVTSDHGESLGEHGESTHSLTLYDATQHVPLLLSAPRLPRGGVVTEPVRLIDVAPTLLELAGVPPLPDANGRSLVPLAVGRSDEERIAYLEAIEPQLSMGWSPVLGIRTASYKYLRAPRPELYDLGLDPDELRNLAEEQPERVSALDEKLLEVLAKARPASTSTALDAADRARLESLGYVVPTEDRPSELEIGRVGGADPKDHMDEAAAMQRAGALLAEGRGERALPMLAPIRQPGSHVLMLRASAAMQTGRFDVLREVGDSLVARRPESAGAHYVRGLGQLGLGELGAAHESFEHGHALDPELAAPMMGLGLVADAKGDHDGALAWVRRADQAEDPHGSARLYLALDALGAGDAEAGEALLATLPDAFLDQPEAVLRIAEKELSVGGLESALARLAKATEKRPRSRRLWSRYASLLERAGRFDDSVRAWRQQLALDPEDPAGWNDLAWGLAVAGRGLDEALGLAQRAAAALEERPAALDTLATVHLARGDAEAALAVVDRALADATPPLRAHLRYVRAAALAELGRIDEARTALSALRAEPEGLDPPWQERAERLAHRLGS